MWLASRITRRGAIPSQGWSTAPVGSLHLSFGDKGVLVATEARSSRSSWQRLVFELPSLHELLMTLSWWCPVGNDPGLLGMSLVIPFKEAQGMVYRRSLPHSLLSTSTVCSSCKISPLHYVPLSGSLPAPRSRLAGMLTRCSCWRQVKRGSIGRGRCLPTN